MISVPFLFLLSLKAPYTALSSGALIYITYMKNKKAVPAPIKLARQCGNRAGILSNRTRHIALNAHSASALVALISAKWPAPYGKNC